MVEYMLHASASEEGEESTMACLAEHTEQPGMRAGVSTYILYK